MYRTAKLALLLSILTTGCDEPAQFSPADANTTHRTAVGDGDPPPDPVLEPDDICAPGAEADDPQSLDTELAVPVVPGIIESRMFLLDPPTLFSGDTMEVTIETMTLAPAEVSHTIGGQRIPYTLDTTDSVFDMAGTYLAEDERITEWVIDRTFDGMSLDCDTVYEAAQQHFLKTCTKAFTKTFTASYLGERTIQADLGSSLESKPRGELRGTVKAYDVTLTYTYDLFGQQLSDPDVSIKAQDAFDNLTELSETGSLKTPIEYELSLLASDVFGGCLYVVGTHTETLDGASESEFRLQWEVEW
jgi:hypothetical protein